MSLRFIIAPYEYPDDEEWDDHIRATVTAVQVHLEAELGADAQFKFEVTNHGVGADWNTLMVEVAQYGSLVFLTVPAIRKKLVESWDGWKALFNDFRKLESAMQKRNKIEAWSKEAALLCAIERLDQRGVSPNSVALVSVIDVPGPSDQIEEEDTDDAFAHVAEHAYVLVFRDGDDRVYVFTYRSDLRLVNEHTVSVAPAWVEDESAK